MALLLKRLIVCGARGLRSTALAGDEAEVPKKGHVRVCVGKCDSDSERFELPVNYLHHPLFEDLLKLSVDEFGYSYDGAIRIACEVELFLHLIGLLRSSDPAVHYMELPDLVSKFYSSSAMMPSMRKTK